MDPSAWPDGCVGCRAAAVTDTVQGAQVPLWLLYPTRARAHTERFGAYTLDVAMDAPVEGEDLPLVLISHGTGGTPWVYRDLAAYLVRQGYVVALPEHPGNNRNDDHLAGKFANLENRPRHVRLAIDGAMADALVGARLARAHIAVIGHSMGGYTALAVAGGRPVAMPHETTDGNARPVTIAADPRVGALVLFAPAAVWYAGDDAALAEVCLPILLFTAERDEFGPWLHADVIARGVRDPSRVDHRLVAGAGHFAFLSPFPPAMCTPTFMPAQDPEGFDRAAFQSELFPEVVAFLQRALPRRAGQGRPDDGFATGAAIRHDASR